MTTIIEEVLKDPENDFTKRTVTCKIQCVGVRMIIIWCISIIVAVKRKYESERRLLRESELDEYDDLKSRRLKKAKYEQRKQRVSSKFDVVASYLNHH